MPTAAPSAPLDFDRHFRRGVWIAWIGTMVGAASMFAAKSADERGAFIRWRHQILDFWNDGTNIWEKYYYPNPPILPISLYPLMTLPPIVGAVAWFSLKAVLAALSVWFCYRMVNGTDRVLPSWVQAPILLLTLRPFLSDFHHGNVNLIILFLVVAGLYAWRNGYDVAAGLLIALAVSYKVTPALFVPYFLWKRQWRVAGAAILGVGIFLLLVPSLVLGVEGNAEAFAMWWQRIMSPYVAGSEVSVQEVNQSMGGLLTRLMTEAKRAGNHGYGGTLLDLNLVAWPKARVAWLIKGLSVAWVVGLFAACRTKITRRDDARLFGEFSLVVLSMLILSERSWKHHYVTLLLPFAYITYRALMAPGPKLVKRILAGSLILAAVLIATTSKDIARPFLGRMGHVYAQFYGMYLWSAVVLYVAVASRVVALRHTDPDAPGKRSIAHELPPHHLTTLPARALLPHRDD